MKLATFNIENMFERPAAMNLPKWSDGKIILQDFSELIDVMAHPRFVGDGRPGTHGNGTASAKLDYILMSPSLAARVDACGIERKGVWGGKNGILFPHIPQITESIEAASDHAALWVEFT